MVMLHKPTAAGGGSSGSNAVAGSNGSNVGGVDVYDPSEPDPAKSRAVESSLWELEALRNHYSPQVRCTNSWGLSAATQVVSHMQTLPAAADVGVEEPQTTHA